MASHTEVDAFDLTPEPRILPMLGEINLAIWRCIAELVDNSIDGLLNAGQDMNASQPEVHVALPTMSATHPRITVRDNGPGMAPETLEKAVRAGWTGNEPIGSLGMFGMGFNIATARLGSRTTVWTTTEGDPQWHGLTIDFQTLIRQRHFRTPRSTRSKNDYGEHGTEISIDRLRSDTLPNVARSKTRITRELAKVYSSMLKINGTPLSFKLMVNSDCVQGRQHCFWGDGEYPRVVSTRRHGDVDALQLVDVELGERKYCSACWQWLLSEQSICPSCDSGDQVVARRRRVHGWIGIQRYLSVNEFGIDFIRHGRKIELANKDLFYWDNDGTAEREYPIDDPRQRGRIIGEIHLDHARVTYTKDRFDRNDPAWEGMVQAIRGHGPLRPEKAEQLGYGINLSPLSLLFQAFRRSNPYRRAAGGYRQLLTVPDNDRAEEMAQRFYLHESAYLGDSKWYELVEDADRQALTESGTTVATGDDLAGFTDTGDQATDDANDGDAQSAAERIVWAQRVSLPAISREYVSESIDLRWTIEAFRVSSSDPELAGEAQPWRLVATTRGNYLFLVNEGHLVFQSATMTALDALLAQLAWEALDFVRGQRDMNATFSGVLAELRERYAVGTRLDPSDLCVSAVTTLTNIGRCLAKNVVNGDGVSLFEELSASDRQEVRHRMAARAVENARVAISDGSFLVYGPFRTVLTIFQRHPERFLDGRYWDAAYESLDYGSDSATQEARARVVYYYIGLLADAVWLAEQYPPDIAQASRERLLRSYLAVDLLAPSVDID